MTLREKQSCFARLVAKLLLEAETMGYSVTLGEAYRSQEEALRQFGVGRGIACSLHTDRLAIDLNLFLDGVWLTRTEDHRQLGEWWERQSTDDLICCWGGRFGDGNHYSLEHKGRR